MAIDEIFMNKIWTRMDDLKYIIRGMRITQNHEGCSAGLWESLEFQIDQKRDELDELNRKYG